MVKGFDFMGSDRAQHAAGLDVPRAVFLRSLGWCSPLFGIKVQNLLRSKA